MHTNIGNPIRHKNARTDCKIKVTKQNIHKFDSVRSSHELLNSSIPPQIPNPASINPKHIKTPKLNPPESLSFALLALHRDNESIHATSAYSHRFDPLQSFAIL